MTFVESNAVNLNFLDFQSYKPSLECHLPRKSGFYIPLEDALAGQGAKLFRAPGKNLALPELAALSIELFLATKR